MLKWYICFLFMLFTFALYAQSGNKKTDGIFQKAQESVRKGDYRKALDLLEKLAQSDVPFVEQYLLQADIYRKLNEPDKEISAIESALLVDSVKYPGYYYVIGDYHYGKGEYAVAADYFENYLAKDKKQNRNRETQKKLANCHFALHALASQQKHPLIPFICSEHDVYWPSLDVWGETILYTCEKNGEENIWGRRDSVDFSLNLNTSDNEGTQSLTADGKMMYFTACGRPDGKGGCDIYVAYRLSDTTWSAPINLGYPVNTRAWEAQPAISSDGTKLYFSSNRDGGKGGSDIWYSRLLLRQPDGRQVWSQPRCLYFNTSGEEMAPFLYYDNRTLFFSSDNYPGMGGNDIYKVDIDAVSTPQNIGITVNTHKDEMGFSVDATGEWGYFASNINGTKDIFKYKLNDEMRCPEMAYISVIVKNEEEQQLIPDRLLVMRPESGDTLARYDGTYISDRMLASVPPGELLLLSVSKKGYMYFSDTLRAKATGIKRPTVKQFTLQKIRENKTLILKGLFFDVNDYQLKQNSIPELEQLIDFMKQNPEVRIEISGHTDNSGTVEHNEQLSENRAFEVYKYLFLQRIGKVRMEYKGYGSTHPLAPNDTEANKAKNRRTEIKIIDFTR